MKKEVFHRVCQLEIGDTVAQLPGDNKTVYYLPPERARMNGMDKAAIHKVTDVATLHYFKSDQIIFLYELDKSGEYKDFSIVVPV